VKIALCLAGHLNTFWRTKTQILDLVNETNCDVFCYTSNMLSSPLRHCKGEDWGILTEQNKTVTSLFIPPQKECSATSKWTRPSNNHSILRKKAHYGYGWNIEKSIIETFLSKTFDDNLKKYFVWEQDAKKINDNFPKTKWDHLRANELYKIFECHKLMEQYEKENNFKYDVIIRMRFDLGLKKKLYDETLINNEELKKTYGNQYIITVGGWDCPKSYKKIGFCHSFCYGHRDAIQSLVEIINIEDPKRYTEGCQPGAYLEPIMSHYLVHKKVGMVYLTNPHEHKHKKVRVVRGIASSKQYEILE